MEFNLTLALDSSWELRHFFWPRPVSCDPGYSRPCYPVACCNGSSRLMKFIFDNPPCVFSPRGWAADDFMYGIGPTYTITVPVITSASGLGEGIRSAGEGLMNNDVPHIFHCIVPPTVPTSWRSSVPRLLPALSAPPYCTIGNISTIHQYEVKRHWGGFHAINRIINEELLTGRAPLPPFASPLRWSWVANLKCWGGKVAEIKIFDLSLRLSLPGAM